jgi:diaminopimelate decarboxylase
MSIRTATLERHAQVLPRGARRSAGVHIAFAVKANPNLAVLGVLARRAMARMSCRAAS